MIYEIDGNIVNVVMSDDMPIGIPEHIWRNTDDSFTLKLNAKYDQSTLETSFEHAIQHIRSGDWEKEDVQLIESEAHGQQITPEQTQEQLPEWVVGLIWDLTLQLYAARATAAFFQGASAKPYRPMQESSDAFQVAEDRWLYDVS